MVSVFGRQMRRAALGAVVAASASLWSLHGYGQDDLEQELLLDEPPAATESKPPAPSAAKDAATTVTVRTVEVVGSNLSGETLKAIFEGREEAGIASLATLSASSIRIPEIKVRYASPSNPSQFSESTYHDIVLDNVRDGVAERASATGFTTASGPPALRLDFGKMSVDRLNIAALMRFYAGTASPSDPAMQLVYANFAMEGGVVTTPALTCDLGRMTQASFSARPLSEDFSGYLRRIGELEDDGTPSGAAIEALFSAYAEMLMAFEASPTLFAGFQCSGADKDGNPISASLGSVTMGAIVPGRYPEIEANDFGLAFKNGTFSFVDFVFKGFDYNDVLYVLEEAGDEIDETWLSENSRKLIPEFWGLRIEGWKMDLPNAQGMGRTKGSIGALDLSLGSYVNGIPTAIALSASNFALEVPTDNGTEGAARLKALGYNDIDVSYDIALNWDPETETIKVDKLSVAGVDMGSFALSGVLGNAVAELFADDTALALAASLGVSLKELKLGVVDDGLGRRLIQLGAAEQGMDPTTFLNSITGAAQGTILTFLGGSPQVQALAEAVGALVSGAADTLDVSIKAKDAGGVGLMDFGRIQENPAALSEIVDIEAAANKRQ